MRGPAQPQSAPKSHSRSAHPYSDCTLTPFCRSHSPPRTLVLMTCSRTPDRGWWRSPWPPCRRAGGRGLRLETQRSRNGGKDARHLGALVKLLRELRQARAHPTESLAARHHRREHLVAARVLARGLGERETLVQLQRRFVHEDRALEDRLRETVRALARRIGQVLHAIVVGAQVGRVADLFAQREGRGRERANGAPRGCGRGQLELRSTPGARARRGPFHVGLRSVGRWIRRHAQHRPPRPANGEHGDGRDGNEDALQSSGVEANSGNASARAECAASFG